MATNLESQGALEEFHKGNYPKDGWEKKLLAQAEEAARGVRREIWLSFLMVTAASLFAVVIAFFFDRVSPDLPLSWPKVFGMVGGFLAAWATLMELGGLMKTYSGQTLHELVHPALFKVLFVPGTLLATVGLLW